MTVKQFTQEPEYISLYNILVGISALVLARIVPGTTPQSEVYQKTALSCKELRGLSFISFHCLSFPKRKTYDLLDIRESPWVSAVTIILTKWKASAQASPDTWDFNHRTNEFQGSGNYVWF